MGKCTFVLFPENRRLIVRFVRTNYSPLTNISPNEFLGLKRDERMYFCFIPEYWRPNVHLAQTDYSSFALKTLQSKFNLFYLNLSTKLPFKLFN